MYKQSCDSTYTYILYLFFGASSRHSCSQQNNSLLIKPKTSRSLATNFLFLIMFATNNKFYLFPSTYLESNPIAEILFFP